MGHLPGDKMTKRVLTIIGLNHQNVKCFKLLPSGPATKQSGVFWLATHHVRCEKREKHTHWLNLAGEMASTSMRSVRPFSMRSAAI